MDLYSPISEAPKVPPDAAASLRIGRLVQLYLSGFGASQITCGFRAPSAEETEQGRQRSILSEGFLWLPPRLLGAPGGASGPVVGEALAGAAHALAHLRFSVPRQPVRARKPLHVAMLSLVEDARVQRLLLREVPGVWELWKRFHTEDGNWGALDIVSLAARLARALLDPTYEDPNAWVNKGRRLFESVADRLEHGALFAEVGSILANDLGQMRVPYDPQTQVLSPVYGDDHSFLWASDEAPPETSPQDAVVRNGVLWEAPECDSDRRVERSAAQLTERERFTYPEWDALAGVLREDWVQVFEYPGWVGGDSGEKQKAARSSGLKGKSALDTRALKLDRRVQLRRQNEGDALDLNGAIEARIHLRAGITPDPRVFERPGRRSRQVAIVLLMDLSESANDRIAGSFTTVLDLEKRAVSVLAKAVEQGPDQLAIHGFQSNGRHEVHYRIFKPFEQAFDQVAAQPLWRQLQAGLSTRLGAALRHGGRLLGERNAEKRILFVLTDGLPSDIDVPVLTQNGPVAEGGSEGRQGAYLLEDARHAVLQLGRDGITVFCLTLDQGADSSVRRIFGARRVQVVDHPKHLSRHLLQALGRVSAL